MILSVPATERIAKAIGKRLPAMQVVESDRCLACSHPMRGVSISSGLMKRLTHDEIEAVVLHECVHLWGHHSLILAGIRIAAVISVGLGIAVSILWFIACSVLLLAHVACKELMESECDRVVKEHGYWKEMFTAHTKVDPDAGSYLSWSHR